MTPGDRILLTIPREPSREGEYIETRGAKCRVLLDGETETRVVLRERVKPVPVRSMPLRVPRQPIPDALLPESLRTHRSVPKPPKPLRDAAYMKWVRDTHSCCAIGCGMPAEEAHHHGPRGMSQKTDDYRVVPLCARCHREVHAKGHPDGMTRESWDAKVSQWQAGLILDYLNYRVTEGDMTGVVDALIAHIRETAA